MVRWILRIINNEFFMRWHGLFFVFVFMSENGYAAQGADYLLDEQPAVKSASEIKGSMEEAFEKQKKQEGLLSSIKNKLKNLPPFWRDTTVNGNFRFYYFERNREQASDSQAFTYGGSLGYQSGWWQDFLKVGATVFTTQKIAAPEDKDGTLLLKPGPHGFFSLSEAFLEVKLTEEIQFKLFRQTLNLPYLNKQDSRMIPNTFEAYVLKNPNSSLKWIVAYVRQMKKRNSNDFDYMTQAAGFNSKHKGLGLFGVRYSLSENTDIGAINYFTEDYMNTFYAEANHVFFPKKELPIHLSLQYTNQQSSGSELGGVFDSYSFGGKMSLSYEGFVLTAAATATGKNRGIQKPFGGTPSYLSIMVEDFDRAGENAWLVGLSYHFDRLGLDGISAYTNYAYGNTPDRGLNKSPDQREWDITVDYKPTLAPLKGLWLRLRRASVKRISGGGDLTDYRVILNYEIQFL